MLGIKLKLVLKLVLGIQLRIKLVLKIENYKLQLVIFQSCWGAG